MKYTAGYTGQFNNIDQVRFWMANFVNWYNAEHRHSAIGYVTPQQRRSGDCKKILEKRNDTLAAARKKNQKRLGEKP
jgi:hypothetical protein